MDLNELYKRLSYGELSNLSIGSEGSGTIIVEKQPIILFLANEALRELSKRFVLRENVLLIEQQEGVINYRLDPIYSIQNAEASGVEYPYIVDSPDAPFNDVVLKILQVYDECGRELPLNDRDNYWSLFTPQNNLLQIPNPQVGSSLSINYQTFLKPILGVDLEETIDIPVVLEKALTSYIAGHVLGNMNTQESNAKSQEHLLRFQAICAEAEEKDLLSISNSDTNKKFEQRGWI